MEQNELVIKEYRDGDLKAYLLPPVFTSDEVEAKAEELQLHFLSYDVTNLFINDLINCYGIHYGGEKDVAAIRSFIDAVIASGLIRTDSFLVSTDDTPNKEKAISVYTANKMQMEHVLMGHKLSKSLYTVDLDSKHSAILFNMDEDELKKFLKEDSRKIEAEELDLSLILEPEILEKVKKHATGFEISPVKALNNILHGHFQYYRL